MTIIDRRGRTVSGTNSAASPGDPNPGLAIKTPCRVATTANITLAGLQAIDGVTVAEGDRVLVRSQTTGSDNGVYVVSSGNWSRAADWDGSHEVVHGTVVFTTDGTLYTDTQFTVDTANPIIIGTTAVSFNILSVALAADLTALEALATTGIAVRTGASTWVTRTIAGTSNRVTVTNGDGVAGAPTLDISSSYAGQSTITTLGTVGTGTWQGTNIAAGYGGTGFASYTIGDLLYASGTTALSKLADVATGNALISGGVGAAPSWGKVGLTTHITGTLGVTNGGLGQSTYTKGDIIYSDATNSLAKLPITPSGRLLTSGSSGIPSWDYQVSLGVPGSLLGALQLSGNTSGTVTVVPQAAAGTATLTLPSVSGTFAVNASAPLALSATTGALTWTGAALTKTDDTNVTMTLGGAPTTAVGTATSMTLGWTGTLAATRGGTGTGTYAVGDILYASTTSALARLADVATGNALISGGVGIAPSWGKIALSTHVSGTVTPQGRLTLVSATPVMTSTQSAKTTVYYTPYNGTLVPIYDGTIMAPTAVAEISVATTDTTKNPAAIGASKVNDWFVWNDSGTIRLSHGPDWTNDTTRSAGTALTMVNGILLNNASITNGPAASRGTYVGTTRSNGSSQIDYIFGAAASGGTAAFFGVWNAYNRVITATGVTDSGVGYTYTTATIRQARASSGNQISFIVGLVEDGIVAAYTAQVNTVTAATSYGLWGASLNSNSTFANGSYNAVNPIVGASTITRATHTITAMPALGVNVIYANELGDGTNANTFDNSSVNQLNATINN